MARPSALNSDSARRIVLRATSDLHLDLSLPVHAIAAEIARVASAAGVFRKTPPGRQDGTDRNHLAKRFERSLDTMLADMLAVDIDGLKTHVLVDLASPSVHMDGRDLESIDHGLRAVFEDEAMFDRMCVRDLVAPQGVEKHVVVDAVRSGDTVTVVIWAMANAIYGFASATFDQSGAVVDIRQPSGTERTPLNHDDILVAWDALALSARAAGRERSVALRQNARSQAALAATRAEECEAASSTTSEAAAQAEPSEVRVSPSQDHDDNDGLDQWQTPEHEAISRELVSPVCDHLTSADMESWIQRIGTKPAARSLSEFIGRIVGPAHPESTNAVAAYIKRSGDENHAKDVASLRAELRTRNISRSDSIKAARALAQIEDTKVTIEDIVKRAEADDHVSSYYDALNALVRIAVMHQRDAVAPVAEFTTIPSPVGGELRPVTTTRRRPGLAFVKNRDFYEACADESLLNAKTRREVPIAILYLLHEEGIDGIVCQFDGGSINLLGRFEYDNAMANVFSEADMMIYAVIGSIHADEKAVEDESAGAEDDTGALAPSTIADLKPAVAITQGRPHDAPMRRVSQVAIGVKDHAAAAQAIDRWFTRTAQRRKDNLYLDQRSHEHGWRLEHSDDGDEHMWAVAVRAGHGLNPKIEVLLETTVRNPPASLPNVIREIASETQVSDLDGPLPVTVEQIGSTSLVHRLQRHLTDPERNLPVLVLTPDQSARFIIDPQQALDMSLGAMRVVVLTNSMSLHLKEEWGQQFSVFNGAARIYQPGFDPTKSNPQAHQRFMPRQGAREIVVNAIRREIAATTRRYELSDELADQLDEAARLAGEAVPHVSTPETRYIVPNYRGGAIRPEKRNLLTPLPATSVEQKAAETAPATPAARAPSFLPDTIADRLNAPLGPPKVEPEPREDEPLLPIEPVEEPDPVLPLEEPAAPAPPEEDPEPEVDDPASPGEPPQEPPLPDEPPAAAEAVDALPPPAEPSAAPLAAPDHVSALLDQRLAPILQRLEALETGYGRAIEERDVARAQHDAVRQSAIRTASDHRRALNAEREDSSELLRIAEQERDDAIAERDEERLNAEALRREVAQLRSMIAELRGAPPTEEPPTPTSLAEIAAWAETRFTGRLVLHPRAVKALRKSVYPDAARVASALELLAGPYHDMKNGVEGARDRYNDALRDCRLKDDPQIDAGGPEAAQYHIVHEGRPMRLDKHLKAKESAKRDRVLRVYYTWDDTAGQVVVGWLPDHLTTADT